MRTPTTPNVTQSGLVRAPCRTVCASYAGATRVSWRLATARVLLTIVVLGCSPSAIVASAPPSTPPEPAAPATVADEIVAHTNRARADASLPPLTRHAQLMRAAQIHAEQMAASEQMSHVLPDARYPSLTDRLAAVAYEWRAIAENIAVGSRSAEAVVDGWMRSAGHRANMLDTRYSEMGAGYAASGSGRPYYVQVFARPAP